MPSAIRKRTALLLAGDVFVFVAALVITLAIRHGELPDRDLLIEHLMPFGALMVLWTLVFFIAGLYDTYVTLIRKSIPDLVLKTQIVNMLLAALFFFTLPIGITPKTVLALYLIVSTTLLVTWRLFVFPILSFGSGARVAIVGSGEEAKELARTLGDERQFGCVHAEVVDIRAYPSSAALEHQLAEVVSAERIDTVIADMSDEYTKRLAPIYYALAFSHAEVRFLRLHDLYEELFRRVPLSLIGKMWFLENVRAGAPHYGYAFVKRTMDIITSLMLLVPCIAIFPVVYIAIKLQDGGKVLYKSDRVGQDNKPVHIYKFRTMTGMDSGETLNTTHTVTRLGRLLRKTRIDELPQLWNILRGDISFVGPRPELPARARVYAETIPYYTMRHLIKPGLTGWAQISNFEVPRGEVDIERTIDKLSFDLFYLKRQSLLFDLEIILKTVKTMLLRSGS